ncbi:hypothetical protein C7E17_25355, partial [Stenotrophomonas maltophilia]
QPLVLSGQESQREIYLPVPAGVATRDAQLQLDGATCAPCRAHVRLWSVDGDPPPTASPASSPSGAVTARSAGR